VRSYAYEMFIMLLECIVDLIYFRKFKKSGPRLLNINI